MTHNISTDLDKFYVYIMASKTGTLYTGQTNNIISRVYEYKYKLIEGFSKKYSCTKLVYYEEYKTRKETLEREK